MAGPVVVPGQPDQSLLVKAVHYTEKDLRMPPHKPGPKLADPDILHRGFGDRLLRRPQRSILKKSYANGREKVANIVYINCKLRSACLTKNRELI